METTLIAPTYEYPSLITRIQSGMVDALFCILLMFLGGKILDNVQETPDWVRAAILIGSWGVYEPLSMAFGCTIGNYLMGIRVRSVKVPEKRINLFEAYIRFIVKFLFGWLSFVAIHFNPQRRALHDLAAGSVMIKLMKEEK